VYDINGEEPPCLQEAENFGSTLELALTLKPWVSEEEEALRVLDASEAHEATPLRLPQQPRRAATGVSGVSSARLHQAIWELLTTTGTVPRTTLDLERPEAAVRHFTGPAYKLD
jgi:hypothetical protein